MRLWGRRVLAVDDDAGSLERVTEVLSDAGAEVIGVGAPEYALPTVVFLRPDILIVDAALGAEGLALVRRLRALPPDQGGLTPALALTAQAATEAVRDEWLQAGFQGHVAKPFDPEALIAAVAERTGYQRGPDDSSASTSPEGRGRAK